MITRLLTIGALVATSFLSAHENQTIDVSPVYPQDSLPFTLEITEAKFQLPNGLHSFAYAIQDNYWLFVAGKMNGLHGFGPGHNNFPPNEQNTQIYVVDHSKKRVWVRNLDGSGLSQAVIDTLSVVSPQFYQKGNTMYMSGGYGVDTATGEFSTKNTLTAFDVSGLIDWVLGKTNKSVSSFIRQTAHEALRVTGGAMEQHGNEPTLLIFGQNFQGYYVIGTNGTYTQQVKRFYINDNGRDLSITMLDPIPAEPYPSFRRRDLNVVPIIEHRDGTSKTALMAYSGVFTPTVGIWTVPVAIMPDGSASMDNILEAGTFKQAMNGYVCATLGMYSEKHESMFTTFFGGISYGYFEDGELQLTSGLPFINQVSTVKIDKHGHQSQYLMDAIYPTILSTSTNPGNELLFGAGAAYFHKSNVKYYENGVLKFDKLPKKRVHIGYIVGGIQSTMPITQSDEDSAASPYIFKVYVTRK